MSCESLGKKWKCDFCSNSYISENEPTEILVVHLHAVKNGRGWGQHVDICQTCFDTEGFFTNPKSEKKMTINFISKIFNNIKRKRK